MTYAQNQADFLAGYPKAQENWEKANVGWEELEQIRANYSARMPALQATADAFSARLQGLPGVHSTRVRLKHPDHLLEKIVRKRAAQRDIHLDNYFDQITDLIGARALHLFKTDWLDIHHAIVETWDQNETPKAYIREGDDAGFYTENGVEHEVHKANYRSVHYGVKTAFTKETHVVEVQVRTIFEEAWGEIDHSVRYPHFEGDAFLEASCALLNRLAGSADEMALLIRLQQAASLDWRAREAQLNAENQEKESALEKLRTELAQTIQKSKASEEEKQDLLRQVESLSRSQRPSAVSPSYGALGAVNSAVLSGLTARIEAMQRSLQPSSAILEAIHGAGYGYTGVIQRGLAAQVAAQTTTHAALQATAERAAQAAASKASALPTSARRKTAKKEEVEETAEESE